MDSDIPFTIDDIRALASESTFSKGMTYFNEGAVGKIKLKNHVFRGKVHGENKYKVEIAFINGKPVFDCSCPYESEAVCKHEVAFALAILDGKYSAVGQTAIDQGMNISYESIRNVFLQTDNKTRSEFLNQALAKDDGLRRQFMAFTNKEIKSAQAASGKPETVIKEIINKIHNEFINMDLDDLVENYNRYDYNYYDDEGYVEEANDMVQEVFQKYSKKSKKAFDEGDIPGSMIYILGCIEASFNAPHPIENEYEVLGDSFNDVVSEAVSSVAEKFAQRLNKIVLTDTITIEMINTIVSRIKIYLKPGKKEPYADEPDTIEPIPFYFIFTEKILLSLLTNEYTAGYMLEILKSNNWNISELASVYIRISVILNDEKLWLDSAEAYAPEDKNIAMLLLDKFRLDNNIDGFARIAKMSFETWPGDFDKYLSDHLDKEANKSLFVNALKHYVNRKKDVAYYLELRKNFSPEQTDKFLAGVSRSGENEFYVKLLEIEKRYDKILELVKKEIHDDYSFHNLIRPVINIYPEECFDLIKKKCDWMLEKYRGRDIYQKICLWLGLIKEIVSKKDEAQIYIYSIYNYKPNLPALRDEMRNAKLVSEKK